MSPLLTEIVTLPGESIKIVNGFPGEEFHKHLYLKIRVQHQKHLKMNQSLQKLQVQ